MDTVQLPALHAGQERIVAEAKRFNVVVGGRRSGKTTLGIDRAVEALSRGVSVGWFAPTYRLLVDVWREVGALLRPATVSVTAQVGVIRVDGGGILEFWSLEKADAARGREYARVIVDEAGRLADLETTWLQTLRPTLTDPKADAWFLGTPRERGDFWKLYEQGQRDDPEWMSWVLPSSSNPHLDPDVIASARRELPLATYRREFEGDVADDSRPGPSASVLRGLA